MMGGMSKGILGELNSAGRQQRHRQHHVMQRDVADMSMSSLDERMVSQIQAMPRVKSVSPMLMGFVMTATCRSLCSPGLTRTAPP